MNEQIVYRANLINESHCLRFWNLLSLSVLVEKEEISQPSLASLRCLVRRTLVDAAFIRLAGHGLGLGQGFPTGGPRTPSGT